MQIEVISDANLSKVLNSIRVKASTLSYDFCVSGDALRLANRHKESIPKYLQAIMKDRTNADAYLGLGLSYKALENYEKAIVYLLKSLEHDTRYSTLLELGMCRYAIGEYADALKDFISAIKLEPENYDAQIWLAMTHEELHEYNMAFLIYDNIIEKNPSYLNAYINKGTLEMSIDRYQDATGTFSQVLKLNPDFYKAYFGIALCFDKLGKYRDAKRYYTKFLTVKPNADVADFVTARLRKLARSNTKRLKVEHLSLVR
jgi:tetratricopeptide (TPR) repeat protein